MLRDGRSLRICVVNTECSAPSPAALGTGVALEEGFEARRASWILRSCSWIEAVCEGAAGGAWCGVCVPMRACEVTHQVCVLTLTFSSPLPPPNPLQKERKKLRLPRAGVS